MEHEGRDVDNVNTGRDDPHQKSKDEDDYRPDSREVVNACDLSLKSIFDVDRHENPWEGKSENTGPVADRAEPPGCEVHVRVTQVEHPSHKFDYTGKEVENKVEHKSQCKVVVMAIWLSDAFPEPSNGENGTSVQASQIHTTVFLLNIEHEGCEPPDSSSRGLSTKVKLGYPVVFRCNHKRGDLLAIIKLCERDSQLWSRLVYMHCCHLFTFDLN